MNRTALRLGVLAALTHGGQSPFPTLAGDCVFDSLRAPIDDLKEDGRQPVIVLRSGEDRRQSAVPGGAGTSRLSRTCELFIEIGVVTAFKPEGGELEVGWPESDAQLEAVLDALEYQVEAALRGQSHWAVWFGSIGAWSILDWKSEPIFTEPEAGRVRLAAREIAILFRLNLDALPKAVRESDPAPAGIVPPLMADVLAKIAADGDGDVKQAAAQLAGVLAARTWPVGGVFPDFTDASVTVEGAADGDDTTIGLEIEV